MRFESLEVSYHWMLIPKKHHLAREYSRRYKRQLIRNSKVFYRKLASFDWKDLTHDFSELDNLYEQYFMWTMKVYSRTDITYGIMRLDREGGYINFAPVRYIYPPDWYPQHLNHFKGTIAQIVRSLADVMRTGELRNYQKDFGFNWAGVIMLENIYHTYAPRDWAPPPAPEGSWLNPWDPGYQVDPLFEPQEDPVTEE